MDDQLRQALADNTAMMGNLMGVVSNLAEVNKRALEKAGVDTRDLNNKFNELGKSASNASATQKSIADANKKYEESMNSLNAATASAVTGLKGFTSALLSSERSFGKYGNAVTSFGDAIGNALKAFGPLGAILGGVVKGMSRVAEVALKQADNLTKGYDDLAKVGGAGALTTRQIMDMGHASGLMSKDLAKLTGVIKANSKDIAGLGLTASDGMKAFASITAITSEQRMAYSKLGVSQEELMKTQGDYLALQMASGRSLKGEIADKAKLQKATLEYQDNLLALSNLTGEDVESIKKKQKDALQELNWQIKNRQDANKIAELEKQGRNEEAAALKAEVENRNKGLSAISAIGSKALTQAMREMQASGTATSKGAQAMIRLGLGPAMDEYNKTVKAGGDANKAAAKLQQEYNKAQNRAIDQAGTNAGLNQDVAESLDLTVDTVARGTQQAGKDLVAALTTTAKQVQDGKKAADPALDARAKLTELEIKAGTEIEKFIAKLNPLVSGFNPTTITAMIGAGAAVGLAGWIGKKLIGGIFGRGGGGMPGPGVPGIPSTGGSGGRAAPKAGGKGGGNAAGTLQTLGQGGGSMLENAAKGLKAFADPRVAIGAAAFGAAIAAVGAGIAGATWIMGKALPSLAEGLQPFEKLDGEKLVSAGKGVAALGGGLAVFGAGGAAAGIGSIISNLSDSLVTFFGGKTPIDKLVEFSKLDINADKVKSNSEAFVAFSKAMAAAGASGVLSGLGEITSAIGSAVTSFYKVDPPFKKFEDFSNLKIDIQRTKNNAEAFATFSVAMAKSGLGTAASGLGNLVGGIADGIGKMFGNKDAVTKFVEFTKLDIDPDKAEKLGIAFAAYISALQGVQGAAMPSISASRGAGAAAAGAAPSGGAAAPSAARPGGAPSGGAAAPAAPAGGAAQEAGTVKLEDLFNFTGGSGSKGHFEKLDSGFKSSLIAAVADYKEKTKGKKLTITSGYRSQEEQDNLYNRWKEAGGDYSSKPTAAGITTPSKSVGSHGGVAIDAGQQAGDLAQTVDLAKYGLRWGGTFRNPDPVHIQAANFVPKQAKNGGMFSGPNSGYPVTLHGNEMVIPNFKIPNLKSAMEQTTKQELPFGSTANATNSGANDLMGDLFKMMENKFNNLINAVEQSNSTQTQILKYSRA